MPRKKKREYGSYTTTIKGQAYAVARLPLGQGKYKKKVKLLSSIGGTKTAARDWAQREIEIYKNGGLDTGGKEWTFRRLADWYSKEFLVAPVYQNGKRLYGLRTYQGQQKILERITEYFGHYNLSQITLDLLWRYKRGRLKTVSIASVNREFALIRTMFKKAKARKRMSENPFDSGENLIEVSLEGSRKSPLTDRTAYRLLARSRKSEQPLLYYLILVFMHTGARPSEIYPFHGENPNVPIEPLIWKNVLESDFRAVKLISYKGRIRKEKIVPTTLKLEFALRKLYLEKRPEPNDLIFPVTTFKTSWGTLCKAARCKGIWMRDFRHYYNSKILKNPNINDVERMLLLGQVQLPTNLRYAQLDDDFIKKYRETVG